MQQGPSSGGVGPSLGGERRDEQSGNEPIEWLTSKEAARSLGITTRTLYRLIDSGELPAYRFGRVIRLQEAEVREFVSNARIKPGELKSVNPEHDEE